MFIGISHFGISHFGLSPASSRPRRILLAALSGTLLFGALALPDAHPAWSQNSTKTVSRVGPFTIDAITQNGRLHRCAATLQGQAGMLRIARIVSSGAFSISVPVDPRATNTPPTMSFHLGRSGVRSYDARRDRERASAIVDAAGMEALQNLKQNITIEYMQKFTWPIGSTPMDAVLSAVESCSTNVAGGPSPAPGQPAASAPPPNAGPGGGGFAPAPAQPRFQFDKPTAVRKLPPKPGGDDTTKSSAPIFRIS